MKADNTVTSICFTGHRDLSHTEIDLIRKRLTLILTKLIDQRGLISCYAGGAIGFDTVAADTVITLKDKYPMLKLKLILPCSGQEKTWNEEQKAAYQNIKEKADDVRVLAPFFYNGCMQARNRELLRNSDICIAYLRRGTSTGGSLNTVLQATKLGIPVINIAEDESEEFV